MNDQAARIVDVDALAAAFGADMGGVKAKIAGINERLDISPVLFSGATQTAMIQAAIDAVSGAGGGEISLLGRTWDIANIGTAPAPGRPVGLLLKPGVILKYGTLRRSGTDMSFDLVRGQGAGTYPAVTDQMGLKNVTLDGCARNRTDGQAGVGGNSDGFNLWLLGVKNPVCQDCTSIDPASWGFRFERCTGGSFINNLTCEHRADINADGVHFVDCSNIAGDGFEIVHPGDDGFIVEAKDFDVENLILTGITVRAKATGAVSSGSRCILVIRDTDVGSTLRRIRNNRIEAVVSDSPYPGFVIESGACEVENNTFIVNSLRCRNGAQIRAGDDIAQGFIRNNTFDLTVSDTELAGIVAEYVGLGGALDGNTIIGRVKNPGDNRVGISLRGSRWAGSLSVDYDPHADKTSKSYGIDLLVTESTLMCESKGALQNIHIRDESSGNTIHLGALRGSSGVDISAVGSAVDTVFIGGSLTGTVSAPSQMRFVGTVGANNVLFKEIQAANCTNLDATNLDPGNYRTSDTITTAGTWPGSATGFNRTGILRVTKFDSGTFVQEWISIGAQEMWFRRYTGGAFGAWKKVTAA